ncbi:stage II sporulation protein M [Candidatus Nanosalina sp. VS9-1]|uniref:stage II sporulation protein M n=1 Tax=Candidatus Nanosalina sp. VS9-1 TaxID=3388566 RepID=UPI0039E1BD1C
MLQELFLLEEERRSPGMLFVLGAVAVFTGFIAASTFFPSRIAFVSVIFAAVPLIFSLTQEFMDDEQEGLPHIPELKMYFSIFAGQASAFFLISLFTEASFTAQRTVLGLSGAAASNAGLETILLNNLGVFAAALFLALVIGSAGAFVLTWNASVLGIFLAEVFSTDPFLALAYVPHASLEMLGFITAGVAGTLISAAVYRKHFDRDTWIDYVKLVALGLVLILVAAVVETA